MDVNVGVCRGDGGVGMDVCGYVSVNVCGVML